jgi:hypothetical protein
MRQEDFIMDEKRRSKRFPVDMKLEVSSLFKQNNVIVDNVHAPIEVINISRSGIGFESKSVLPIDYYFNAKIQLGDADSCLYTVVRIVRQERVDDSLLQYGAEFVGMPSVLMYIFDEFEEQFAKEE